MFTHCLALIICWIRLVPAYFLSAIDLASGYPQVGLAKDAQEKTAFVTCYVVYLSTLYYHLNCVMPHQASRG